ncbi:DNA/RNA non-specific endonuclease [Lacticaseibacillus kribbianus]|uniref:DNA/RNA non-specific endonuclease n=1 Tax=Lacticaseibacillus kribbianus TaxID=2926292 RepID=UPI001CD4F0AC|nr:DNA/RNA non-specific endonuclease [Lacticaseibacillus kribbianus]
MIKKIMHSGLVLGLLLLAGCSAEPAKKTQDPAVTKFSTSVKATKAATSSLQAAIKDVDHDLSSTKAEIASLKDDLAADKAASSASAESASKAATEAAGTSKNAGTSQKASASHKPATVSRGTTPAALAAKTYAGNQELTVDNNAPGFSAAELSTAHGAWERYADLDGYNRAVVADAMLNTSLMPTEARTALTWDPTGWHNRRTAHGWLYNRSHLIGFQLSGENNNPKNLITGTQSLNNPLMLAHEMDIATYLKGSSRRYVRYEVRPIYRGQELVARGVQMRAQSIGDNTIRFNVFIFNVEDGYTINYATGTSTTN